MNHAPLEDIPSPLEDIPYPPLARTDTHDFAPFIRILGRGPGRSRSLTRTEARQALGMVLRGEATGEQIGALLMLLRYRGEATDEHGWVLQVDLAIADLQRLFVQAQGEALRPLLEQDEHAQALLEDGQAPPTINRAPAIE